MSPALAPDDHPLAGSPSMPFVTARHTVGRSPVQLLRVSQPAGDYSEPPSGAILLVRADVSFTGRFDNGAGAVGPRVRAGEFQVIAPDAASATVIDVPSKLSAVVLPLEPMREALADVALDFRGDFGPLHARSNRNPRVERLLDLLWSETSDDSPLGALFAENAAQTLVVELLRQGDALGREARERVEGGVRPLSATELARVEAHVEERLGEALSLDELAGVARLSPWHFSRAFKAATGSPPHRYVIERRVARARERLERGVDPIVDVALECGFSSQAHMTSTFTRQLGVSPGRYRKERGR